MERAVRAERTTEAPGHRGHTISKATERFFDRIHPKFAHHRRDRCALDRRRAARCRGSTRMDRRERRRGGGGRRGRRGRQDGKRRRGGLTGAEREALDRWPNRASRRRRGSARCPPRPGGHASSRAVQRGRTPLDHWTGCRGGRGGRGESRCGSERRRTGGKRLDRQRARDRGGARDGTCRGGRDGSHRRQGRADAAGRKARAACRAALNDRPHGGPLHRAGGRGRPAVARRGGRSDRIRVRAG